MLKNIVLILSVLISVNTFALTINKFLSSNTVVSTQTTNFGGSEPGASNTFVQISFRCDFSHKPYLVSLSPSMNQAYVHMPVCNINGGLNYVPGMGDRKSVVYFNGVVDDSAINEVIAVFQ